MSLYAWVLLLSFLGPFFLSFDKKVAFYHKWKHLLLPLFFVSVPFIFWDHFFTELGLWGFTQRYIGGWFLGSLPIEECLFFVVVPYNCVFIYEVLGKYFTIEMKTRFNACFFVVFILAGLALVLGNLGAWYTMTAVPFALSIALVLWLLNPKWLTHFIFTYLVCLIPFLIVNGVLTGAVTQGPIVWYHPTGFSGIRMVTIPVEDLFYNFDLLLGTVVFYNLSKNLFLSQK